MTEDQSRVQEAKSLLARAATYIPGCDPWLASSNASGSWVYDLTGSRYLDFGVGGRVSLLGHFSYAVSMMLKPQMAADLYPGPANEVAVKYPVLYAKALSRFFPMVDDQPQQVLVCSGTHEAAAALAQMGPSMKIRTVSAAGPLDGGLVQDLVHQARSDGKLVVADETLTGFGRTGTFLAAEQFNFRPDVVLLGPSGGGGVPFAALVAPVRLFERLGDFRCEMLSPMACAAAYGVLAGITPELIAHVGAMGDLLERSVGELAIQFPHHITGCTGRGLLRQLTLVDQSRAEKLWKECRASGLVIGADLTLTPPLTVAAEEITAAADVLADVLLNWDLE